MCDVRHGEVHGRHHHAQGRLELLERRRHDSHRSPVPSAVALQGSGRRVSGVTKAAEVGAQGSTQRWAERGWRRAAGLARATQQHSAQEFWQAVADGVALEIPPHGSYLTQREPPESRKVLWHQRKGRQATLTITALLT